MLALQPQHSVYITPIDTPKQESPFTQEKCICGSRKVLRKWPLLNGFKSLSEIFGILNHMWVDGT